MAPPRSPQDPAKEEGSAGAADATGARAPRRTAQATAPEPGQDTGRRLLSLSEQAALRRKLREKFH
jgi:hypothetical protein